MLGLKIFVPVHTFRRMPFAPSRNFCHPATSMSLVVNLHHSDQSLILKEQNFPPTNWCFAKLSPDSSQSLCSLVPQEKNFQAGSTSFPSNSPPLKQHLQLAKSCSHLEKVTSFPFWKSHWFRHCMLWEPDIDQDWSLHNEFEMFVSVCELRHRNVRRAHERITKCKPSVSEREPRHWSITS